MRVGPSETAFGTHGPGVQTGVVSFKFWVGASHSAVILPDGCSVLFCIFMQGWGYTAVACSPKLDPPAMRV